MTADDQHFMVYGTNDWQQYLVLTHAMTRVEDDPLAHHYVFICRVVVKAVVELAPVFQLLRVKSRQVSRDFQVFSGKYWFSHMGQ